MTEITIDPDFSSLLMPLTADEKRQLEENIIEHGCRDPLVTWRGILIDGHNRYDICTRHSLPFETVGIDLPDREAVADWMDANQLGRRNLTPDAFRYLLGRRYKRQKKAAHRPAKVDQIDPVSGDQIDTPKSTAAKLAKEHGTSEPTVKRAAKFAEEVDRIPELKQAIDSGRPVIQVKRELREKRREQRRAENKQKIESVQDPAAAVEGAKFATIVIDPPWDWGDEGDVNQLGRAKPDYSTMSMADLMDLPVGDLADDDCHLYLWITNRSLPKGFQLIERWGFRYITALTWVKPHYGMGNYFRGQTEHVLFAVRGSQPLKRKDIGTVFNAPRGSGGHSSKPVEFYEIAESASPSPYIEMFSRSERDGWVAWGEDAGGD